VPGSYIPVDKLVAELGLPLALKLAEAFGGTAVYVPTPERLRENHPLVMVLGLEAAKKLAAEWPQHEVIVPICADYLRRIRNRQVRADRASLTAREAAQKYETTERHIFRIWASPDDEELGAEPEQQQKLF
jgi:Mor family transcriptional regulator